MCVWSQTFLLFFYLKRGMHNIGDSGFKLFSDLAESLGLFNLKVSNSEFMALE